MERLLAFLAFILFAVILGALPVAIWWGAFFFYLWVTE